MLAVLGTAVLFGDNVRKLFGASADSLAGEEDLPAATRAFQLAIKNDVKKSLRTFGAKNDQDYGSDWAPGTHPEPLAAQPTQAPNETTSTDHDPRSTFAIDVDTASYTLARRQLRAGFRVEPSTVRVEEWVNAFRYSLKAPTDGPWAIHVEGAPSPFTPGRTLLKVALQGRRFSNEARKPANLVLLVDTSCSMAGDDRLGLAKSAMKSLVAGLDERDSVAITTYAGTSRVVLKATNASRRQALNSAIDSLEVGGGTNLESGMVLAYREAAKGVRRDVASRVLVFTDGDANIGATSSGDILSSVKAFVNDGVTLTTVGFGMGNYRDHTLEQLADSGNGQSLYIDGPAEAERVFSSNNLPGLLQVISKDVKVQVTFDERAVRSYRLLGYENRAVADADFRNDAVDGGELGAGHAVTALYELELTGSARALGTISVRGKQPATDEPFEVTQTLTQSALHRSVDETSADFRFAAGVAMAADVLRGNPRAGVTLEEARALAETAASDWPERREFLELLALAQGHSEGTRVSQAGRYRY